MGDHRATIKIEFHMYGLTKEMDSWINWSPDSELPPLDQRVIDFFMNSYQEMRAAYEEEAFTAEREASARELERQERETLARLKDKYE